MNIELKKVVNSRDIYNYMVDLTCFVKREEFMLRIKGIKDGLRTAKDPAKSARGKRTS